MNIFVVLALAMLLIIVALRKKVPIGPAILAGGLLIWVAVKPEIPLLGEAAKQMLTMQRTYDLLFALYFVVCLPGIVAFRGRRSLLSADRRQRFQGHDDHGRTEGND